MPMVKAKIFYLPNYDLQSWGPMKYVHATDTGFDVRACVEEDVELAPMERKIIPLGFKIAPQEGYAFQLRARSGNAIKLGLCPVNGVGTIDNEYRGEVGIILVNLSDKPVVIERGMRVGQGVVEPIHQFEFEIVDSEEELGTSSRVGGFGSTGVK